MSNAVENLHTAIRRYCLDNYSHWIEKYDGLVSAGKNRGYFGYSNKALDIFPRYLLLNAILVEVERYRPEEFAALDEAKQFFHFVVNESQSEFTKTHDSQLERKATAEERDALCKFIDQLNENDLTSVEPLFYRRVLSDEELNFIRGKLSSRWEMPEHYWYPLAFEKPNDAEAFQDAYFEREVSAEKLKEILCGRGVKKVWELREHGASYELELSIFEPDYNGAEGFWCDNNYDWIIYASHESSITIGGWLLPEIQASWANWKERVWTKPFFD